MSDTENERVVSAWQSAYVRVREFWPQSRSIRYANKKALRFRLRAERPDSEEGR